MARPSKLTPEVLSTVSSYLAVGSTLEVAASAAGVGTRTLERWLQRARELVDRVEQHRRVESRDRVYLELMEAITTREAEAEVKALATIQKSALGGDWRAAAWYLEKRHPDKYGVRRRPVGRPLGAGSAPDRRPGSGSPATEPPRLRLASSSSS